MGNKSLNKTKNKDESKIITNKKRKKELIFFLLPNLKTDKDPQNQIENKSPFLPFTSRFDKENDFIDSHFILISNDIILIPTKHIYKEGRTPFYFSFPLNINKVPFDKYNLIIENENYNNKYSIIKVLKYNFLFKNYFDIPNDTFNIESNEKYFINEKDEEELLVIKTLNCKDNNKKINSPWSPIFIKRDNKLYIIGIITEKCEPKIFNKGDLSKIKEKIENVEVEFKFQFKLKTELKLITKLDFNKQDINDEEMNFFFNMILQI